MGLMSFEILIFLMILAAVLSVIAQAKSILKFNAKLVNLRVKIVDKSHNVESIVHYKREQALREAAQLLLKTESLEKMFEFASDEELRKYEIEFRFERRRNLVRLKALGILESDCKPKKTSLIN